MSGPGRINRRQFVGGCIAMPAMGALEPALYPGAVAREGDGACRVFWGDLHNHNAVGYAKGSLERTFRIARELLDFHAFTAHSQWHDMPEMAPENRDKFLNGFKVVRERWPEVQRMCADYHAPGRFVTFPGYEWHSSGYGDYCLIFPHDNAPLEIFDDLKPLQAFAKKEGVLLIPHHPANRQGNRGANFDTLDTAVSPVLEIYSEWGNAERDGAPFPYIRHSHGGVWSRNTWQHALKRGLRLGAIAGTDDHFGYPGAYREGLTAVLAPELTREALFDAVQRRRTYGVSGDRIGLDFRIDGHLMGEAIPYRSHRPIAVKVSGWDEIEEVEVVRNGAVIHRDHPIDRSPAPRSWNQQVLLRLEFGWGPWAALDNARVCDWNLGIEIAGGRIEGVQPCFQSGPCEETKMDRIFERTGASCRVQSFTSRKQAFAEDDTKGVVLRMTGTPEARLRLNVEQPAPMRIDRPLSDFVDANEVIYTGPFPSESIRISRVVFAERHTTAFDFTDKGKPHRADWYYVRVRQANEQLAWSSPIWVEATRG